MLTIKITALTISLSDEVKNTITKKFSAFDRFTFPEAPQELLVTATKTTAHQREDTFRVEAKFKNFFSVGEGADIITAADMAKSELMREVTQAKEKRITLIHRGARKLKKLMRSGFRRNRG